MKHYSTGSFLDVPIKYHLVANGEFGGTNWVVAINILLFLYNGHFMFFLFFIFVLVDVIVFASWVRTYKSKAETDSELQRPN